LFIILLIKYESRANRTSDMRKITMNGLRDMGRLNIIGFGMDNLIEKRLWRII